MAETPLLREDPGQPGQWLAAGDWTLAHARQLEAFAGSGAAGAQRLDARGIGQLDASGAMLLWRLARRLGLAVDALALRPEHAPLFAAVQDICTSPARRVEKDYGFRALLARAGFTVEDYAKEVLALVAFTGEALLTALKVAGNPRRWRFTATVAHMESVGLDAVPLVLLLSFMVGAVVAFLGAEVLAEFGAEIFVVELIGIAFLREFGVLLTAVLLAGRTASAFTAQIGAMQSGEEIDAIRTLGLDPMELLVLPRLVALLLMLPLLSFLAMLAGIGGGITIGASMLGISPDMFIARLHETIEVRHFLVGMAKAPVFALVIGLIGCLEGMQVQGTAQSVGERTTSSVVQTISLVIVIDALAALWFMEMGF
ncbi:MlaE family ABC transporter permease [Silanimonas lenta]|uniref:MlaE family ABC transporter permease n=1 Tax=Silanimonas lenta TaxID=265429 RepID=UPI000417E147|nr:ABC transporter permease [Silanimonas lenta]